MTPFIFLATFLLPLMAYSSPAEEREDDRVPLFDSVQEFLGARANFAANRLDSFFATERADDEFGRSRIRIRGAIDLRDRAKPNFDLRYRFSLRLPHLEEKLKWRYWSTPPEDGKKKDLSLPPPTKKVDETLWRNRLFRDWLFSSDLGVSVAVPPQLIGRLRARRSFSTDTFIHRFVEQVTYVTDESGLVEETLLDSDLFLRDDLVFRFINLKRWQISDKEFSTTHGPTLLHQLTMDDAFNYGLTLNTVIDDGIWFVNNYRFAMNYRRNLYRQWIFFDFVPGVDFPKEWSFRRTPFLSFQIELLFGRF